MAQFTWLVYSSVGACTVCGIPEVVTNFQQKPHRCSLIKSVDLYWIGGPEEGEGTYCVVWGVV